MSYKILLVIEKSLHKNEAGSVAVSTQVIEFDNENEAELACTKIDRSTVSQSDYAGYTSMRAIPLY